MRTAFLATVTLALATFAGCLQQAPPELPDEGDVPGLVNTLEGYVDPFIMNHDHSLAKNHELAFHMRQLSHHGLGGSAVKSSGAHVVDVQGDWLFVGAYGLVADVDGGVYIFSLADPLKPKLTGQFRLPGNVGGDRSLMATQDANWVVLGTEVMDCANHVNPFGPGLYLIDARDKTNPKLADYKPDTGVHSVIVHRVGDKDYAVTLGGGRTENGRNIWEIDTANGKLKAIASVPMSHDGAIFDDPLLGVPLLYVANVRDLVIYDFSNPAAPAKLGSWTPPNNRDHYVHAVAMGLIDDRRILALESEDWGSLASPLWILDATDLAAIEHISTHTNLAGAPANAGGEGGPSLAFSTHNPRIEDGKVYMAHYHAGVWILDVSSLDKARAPEIMGYFLPHQDNGGYRPQSSQSVLPIPPNPNCFGGFRLHEVPNVMDVEVRNGIVYAADLHTGLYVLQYDASVKADEEHKH
jgi:hypothetical protein